MDARIKSGRDEYVPSPVCQNKEAAAALEQPQPLISQLLLLVVADAIDRAGPVVGDEDGTVLGQHDIGRAAEIALIAFEPAGCKDLLLGVLAIGIDDDAFDPRALIFVADAPRRVRLPC